MQITIYSVLMTVIWSSILILLFSFLRRKCRLLEVCSVTGVISLYLFCLVRMLVPIELPWTVVITLEHIYNPIYSFLETEVVLVGERTVSIYRLFIMAWAVVFVVLLLRLVFRYSRMNATLRHMECRNDKRLGDILTEIQASEKWKISPEVVECSEMNEPMSMGIIRRRILIPNQPFTDSELRFIIRHEYTHLRNRDLLAQLLVNILCVIYWWNPLVYLLQRNLRQDFEIRCDQTVVGELDDNEKADYLETILKVYCAKKHMGAAYVGELNMLGERRSNNKGLVERFAIIAANLSGKHHRYGTAFSVVVAMLILTVSYSFVFQSDYEADADEFAYELGGYEVDQENTFVIFRDDGTYLLVTGENEIIEIDEAAFLMLENDGFKVVED